MTLVASIVELASAFDLITVAEGVETAEQLAALRALRCSHSQGFLHSAAVPAQELEQMLVPRATPGSDKGPMRQIRQTAAGRFGQC